MFTLVNRSHDTAPCHGTQEAVGEMPLSSSCSPHMACAMEIGPLNYSEIP